MHVAQLRAEINLCSNDVENELDPKSIDLGFLIEKGETISDFSYKFLSDCRKGFAFPHIDEEQMKIYDQTKSQEDFKIRTWQTSFGLPNRYDYPSSLGKNYDYNIDGHLEQMSRVSLNPIHGKTLCMVVSATLLNGGKYKPYPRSDYEMGYFRPLYIGKTDNLYKRWKNHHRRDQFNFLCQLDIELFLLMYYVYEEDANLKEMEKVLIRELNPLMNEKPVLERKKKMFIPNTIQGKVFPNSIFTSQNDIG